MVLQVKNQLHFSSHKCLSMVRKKLRNKHPKEVSRMTQNQIRWQEHLEQKRHNLKTESQTDVAQLETTRHNVADESIRRDTNAINDSHFRRSDAETAYHNRITEAENERHNRASEYGTLYSADMHYAASTDSAAISAAATRYAAAANAAVGYANVAELATHNRAQERVAVYNAWANRDYQQGTLENQAYSNETNRRSQESRAGLEASQSLLYQQQNLTEQRKQSNLDAQTQYYNSSVNLNDEKARTERSQRWKNYSDTVENYVSVLGDGANLLVEGAALAAVK